MLTYDPTPERLKGLDAATATNNAARAALDPPLPPLTADEYWEARNNDILDSYLAELVKAPTRQKRIEAYEKATPEEQAAADALLKVPADVKPVSAGTGPEK